MPDILKEQQEALVEAVERLVEKQQRRRAVPSGAPGRALGAGQDNVNLAQPLTQDHFTTGYNSGTGVTTTPFILGISLLDFGAGEDIFTM